MQQQFVVQHGLRQHRRRGYLWSRRERILIAETKRRCHGRQSAAADQATEADQGWAARRAHLDHRLRYPRLHRELQSGRPGARCMPTKNGTSCDKKSSVFSTRRSSVQQAVVVCTSAISPPCCARVRRTCFFYPKAIRAPSLYTGLLLHTDTTNTAVSRVTRYCTWYCSCIQQ